jgi:hypothetical protein
VTKKKRFITLGKGQRLRRSRRGPFGKISSFEGSRLTSRKGTENEFQVRFLYSVRPDEQMARMNGQPDGQMGGWKDE